MSYTQSDWRLAITNLLKSTSKEEVSWETTDIFEGDVWHLVDASYKCVVNDKIYVVSRTRRKNYIDEDEYYWVMDYDFSIFRNSFDKVKLASAPSELSIISTLFNAAENSYAYSSNALGDLL